MNEREKNELVQMVAAACILRARELMLLRYTQRGWKLDTKAIQEHMAGHPFADGPGRPGGMRLVRALPQRLDHLLREMNFDGSPDWDRNPDVLKWLPSQPDTEFLRMFPLSSVSPEEFGVKTIEPPPKEENDYVALPDGRVISVKKGTLPDKAFKDPHADS